MISNSIVLDEFIANSTVKNPVSCIKYEDFVLNDWDENNFAVIVHAFSEWSSSEWRYLLDHSTNNVMVIVTEQSHDVALLRETFNHEKIFKIVVCVDTYAKLLRKIIPEKRKDIRFIPLLYKTLDETFVAKSVSNAQLDAIFPKILIPANVHNYKNYQEILEAIHRLSFSYPNILGIFLIQDEIASSNLHILDDIYDLATSLKIDKHIRIISNDKEKYIKYFNYCDMVLVPQKNNNKLYYGSLFDAIKAGKPAICPRNFLSMDIAKKEAGIFLYEECPNMKTDVIEGIVENCSIITENKEIRDILSIQNETYSILLDHQKNSSQFLSLLKKLTKTRGIPDGN